MIDPEWIDYIKWWVMLFVIIGGFVLAFIMGFIAGKASA